MDEDVGRVQFASPRNFLNPIVSKLDKHVVLLPINYIASKEHRQARVWESPQAFSLRFAQHATGQTLWVFLFWLFSLISSKSVASISGNLAEDLIWNSESSKRWREKSGNSAITNTKQNPASDDRSRWKQWNSCNLICQYSVHVFILKFNWLMARIQIFLKLDVLFKAEGNVPAKTIQFILNLDSWQKLIKNRSVGNIGFWCSYIIIPSTVHLAPAASVQTNIQFPSRVDSDSD